MNSQHNIQLFWEKNTGGSGPLGSNRCAAAVQLLLPIRRYPSSHRALVVKGR